MTLNMPYDEVVKRIVTESKMTKDEVTQRINEKVEELGGLITLEGAAHIVAREMDINLYDSQQIPKPKPIKIKDLIDGMNNVTITALVKNIYQPKTFSKKDGTQGAVQNVHLVDNTGACRLVIWDDQIRQFQEANLSQGDLIRINNAYAKESKYDGVKELGLNSRSHIEPSPTDVDKKDFPDKLLELGKISDLTLNQSDVEIIGQIISIRPLSTFTKKDNTEGQVASIEIADETGKTRVTLWDTMAEEVTKYKVDDVIKIIGGYIRSGMNNEIEVHLGKNALIEKKSKVTIDVPKEILESSTPTNYDSSSQSKEPSKEVRLSDLDESMRNISIIARVTGISNIRTFQRKDGTTSEVGSLLVKDNSSDGRITFWNSMTDYIKQVDIGDVIRVEKAYVRKGLRGEAEVHVGKIANVEINPEYLDDAVPSLDLQYSKISELEPRQRDVNVKAIIMRVQEIRTFSKSSGKEGQVLNIGIGDSTGSTRLVAWDEKAVELESIEEMTSIEVLHGYTKEGQNGVEVHLGSLSSVRPIEPDEELDVSKIKQQNPQSTPAKAQRVDMVDLEDGSFSEIRGTIMKVYEGNLYYNSCPKCRKKVEETEGNWKCLEHGEITPEQVIFFSLALDDGTGCVRVTFFREHAEEILDQTPANIIDEIEQVGIQAIITKFEQRLKGREYIVRGKARKNKFDDGMDLIVSSFSEMDAKSEIELVKSTLKV
ncbi:MAG: DUF2240 family protein [Candidatus Heimdallarchaeota archaeon]